MNIFGFKSGHFSYKNHWKNFQYFLQKDLQYLIIFQSGKGQICSRTLKIIKYSNNLWKMKKTRHFLPLFEWPLLEAKKFIVQSRL